MELSNNHKAFLALVKAGLWNQTIELHQFGGLDYDTILQLAEEQSVVGLVTAGLELVRDVKVPQEVLLQFIGSTLQVEQRNKEMNAFIPKLFRKLRSDGVDVVLVKGQGAAQCYEKPLWRASGDVDLLLDTENYEKAKKVLIPIAYDVEAEETWKRHQAMKIMGVEVELHGRMPFGLSEKVDEVIDDVINTVHGSQFMVNGCLNTDELDWTDVMVPRADEHVFLVFTHFLRHFFIEGVGLRQLCDWCRMLWAYRESLNYELLEERIRKAGLVTEWQAFASLAVDYLGMPMAAMPLYDSKFNVKGVHFLKRVIKSGNFGYNNDLSYRTKYTGMRYKIVASWRRFVDFASLVPALPVDAPSFYVTYLLDKARQ